MSTSVPSGILEKFTTFGDLLRYLRRASGLTQLELSVQVGYSHAQISRLEQNLRMPDIPTIEARFVPALGLEREPQVVARLLDLAANVRREDAPGLGMCPYKGLSFFDESDADLFVGREILTARLTERVLSLTSNTMENRIRFLAVVGASGSGKSSLVRAGLVPALRWNKKSADWQIHILTPTAHPLENIATTLTSDSESVTAAPTLMDDLSRDPRSLHFLAKRRLRVENNTHLLLVIDQFEESFALCRSEEERSAFIDSLLMAASEADGPVIVLITLRADFYAHCANYLTLREALAQNQEYIGAMSEEELRRAIEEPARRGRWELEAGLIDLLLHDVGHEPGALPLLSHALFETWQRRRGRLMTMSGYTSSGGVRGAIAETAEIVFTDYFTHEQRIIARRIFLRLTELSEETSTADTRRRATFNELILRPEETAITHIVLKALADARLIITSEDSVEVAHEALIREWPTLRSWLEDNREGLRLHRQLTEAAQEWSSTDRSPDMLSRGVRLAQIREWSSTHHDEMNTLEHAFLEASIQERDRLELEEQVRRQREIENLQKLADTEKQRAEEQTRSAEQLRKRAVYLTGAFLIALLMAFAALFLGRQAQLASRLAISRELALASIGSLEVDPERSVLLALKALERSYTIEAEDALRRAVQAARTTFVVPAHEPGAPMMVNLSPDGSQFVTASNDQSVKTWDAMTGERLLQLDGYYAAYSPDGTQLAITLPNGTIKLINIETGNEIRLPGQIDSEFAIAFSPDGSRLVTVAPNNTAKLWDAASGRELSAFTGHSDLINSVAFNTEGTRILTASDDGSARVWDTGTGEQLLILSDHPGWVLGARFSTDGRLIATISGDESVLWDAGSGQKLLTLLGHKNLIFTVAFSPDGSRLVTGGFDRKIIVWDVRSGAELFRLSGHTGAVVAASFSTSGERLISSSDDGTIRVWDVRPGRELLAVTMHEASGQIAFNMDGTHLATTDETEAIQIWDTRSGRKLITLPDPETIIKDLAFDRAGKRMFAAGEDGKLTIWDSSTGAQLAVRNVHTSGLTGIAVSPDSNRLATSSSDYKVKIWDISSGKISEVPLLTLEYSSPVYSVAFDPEGKVVAVGGQEGNTSLWDTTTQKEIRVLRGHVDFVMAISFRPDGKRITTSSADGTAKVWDVSTGQELFSLGSHAGAVTSIAYSPDGARLATASEDGTAKLWDASTGEELLTLVGDGSVLYDILFSPDGKLLATGGEGGVQVYLVQIEDLVELAKTRVTRSLTSEECRKYLHLDEVGCAPAASVPTTTPIPSTDQGRVCQVTNTAGLYDDSFNEAIYQGLQQARGMFGWDIQVLQSASQTDFARNIKEFLRGDCDLIVGVFSMSDAIRDAAESNPKQRFHIEFEYDRALENVWMQSYAIDQAAFLAGYTAASVTKTGRVGVFGGVDIPQVTVFLDGFALGVDYYNRKNGTSIEILGWNMETRNGLFAGDFCCAARGREVTNQLLDQGADVIFPVAGTDVGAGALYAVKTHGGAYLIGVDNDWAVTNSEYANIILTSVIKHSGVSVVEAVQALEGGTFTGGLHVGTLETGEVGLAPFYQFDSLVSAKIKTDLEQIENDIIAGKIRTLP